MTGSIVFDPLLPWGIIAGLAVLAALGVARPIAIATAPSPLHVVRGDASSGLFLAGLRLNDARELGSRLLHRPGDLRRRRVQEADQLGSQFIQ